MMSWAYILAGACVLLIIGSLSYDQYLKCDQCFERGIEQGFEKGIEQEMKNARSISVKCEDHPTFTCNITRNKNGSTTTICFESQNGGG
jgi:hypothetical protein